MKFIIVFLQLEEERRLEEEYDEKVKIERQKREEERHERDREERRKLREEVNENKCIIWVIGFIHK